MKTIPEGIGLCVRVCMRVHAPVCAQETGPGLTFTEGSLHCGCVSSSAGSVCVGGKLNGSEPQGHIQAQTVALEVIQEAGDRLEMEDEPKRGAQVSSLFLPRADR